MPETPVVLTIAGYDPSSGAGITADVKTAAAHGCYAVTCITGLTVQSTLGVRQVEPVRSQVVAETLAELSSDVDIAAVRIGMLGSKEVAITIARFLETRKLNHIVLDPVIKATSGADLLDKAGIPILRDRLLRLADVITPNTEEASFLVGLPVTNLDEMRRAAMRLHEMGVRAIVITGGHLPEPVDLLSVANGPQQEFSGERLDSPCTHGTGCAFAMALACRLAGGAPLPDAVAAAKRFVADAIRSAYPMGRGHGPINHLYGI